MGSRVGVTGEIYWVMICQLKKSCKLGRQRELSGKLSEQTQGVRWSELIIS